MRTASHEDASTAFIWAGYGLSLPKSLNKVMIGGNAFLVKSVYQVYQVFQVFQVFRVPW